jgi:hypothetical protein
MKERAIRLRKLRRFLARLRELRDQKTMDRDKLLKKLGAAEREAGIDPDPANAKRITIWAKDYWNALRPHTAGGAYVNFMVAEGIPQEQLYLAEQIHESLVTWIAAHLSGV